MREQEDIRQVIRDGSQHRFRVTDAKAYGVTEAILLANLRFWILKNKASGKHFHKLRTWTYNSYKTFSKLFPYLSESQIKRALASLVKQGAIVKDNFNKRHYDRTNWYALAEEPSLPIATSKRSDTVNNSNGRHKPVEKVI